MKQTLTSLFVVVFLSSLIFKTKDLLSIIIYSLFMLFALCLFIKNILIILKKEKAAKMMMKLSVIVFSIYYFGFIIVYDYVSIVNNNYIPVLFSLIPLFGGLWIVRKKMTK